MALIDYKKTDVIVPQSWVKSDLKIYKISDKDTNFITEAMKNLNVELTAEKKTLTAVKI